MMEWFGTDWGAECCEDETHAATPVGEPCAWCDEPIVAGDDGFIHPSVGVQGLCLRPWHRACELRMVTGGAYHQLQRCRCFGGSQDPDPPGLTRREAAQFALLVLEWRWNQEDLIGRLRARIQETLARAEDGQRSFLLPSPYFDPNRRN